LHATGKSLIFFNVLVMNLFRQNSRRHHNEDMLKWFKALLELLKFESGIELCTHTWLHFKKMLECSHGDNFVKQ